MSKPKPVGGGLLMAHKKKVILETKAEPPSPPSEAIQAQVAREAQELAAVPKSPAVVGKALRCHTCGKVVTELFKLQQIGNFTRLACADCYPAQKRALLQHPPITGTPQ